MDDYRADHDATPMNKGRRQLVITAQLYKAIAYMSHIDELFQWLATEFVRSFHVQVAQFWALRANRMGQMSVELRTCVSQDPAFPLHFVVNNHLAATAQQLLSGQYDNMLRPVENLFTSYQAATLTRFGLYHCSCSFLRSGMPLPPVYNDSNARLVPIPLSVAVLLYFRHPPTRDTLSAIDLILEQAVSLSESRFLRASGSTTSGQVPAVRNVPLQQQSSLSLYEIIPKRNEDNNLLMSSNPLSGSTIIPDKRARRFYTAVNNVRNVKEICEHLHIDLQEASAALQILVNEDRIHLCEPDGQLVESSVFFDQF